MHNTRNKIAVVSIFGKTKTGKSDLLNRLLKVEDAFEVRKKPASASNLQKLMG